MRGNWGSFSESSSGNARDSQDLIIGGGIVDDPQDAAENVENVIEEDDMGLGPVAPLWTLVTECILLAAETDEDETIFRCMVMLARVCMSNNETSHNFGEEGKYSLEDLVRLTTPKSPVLALRAVVALVFDSSLCGMLLNCLREKDELELALSNDAGDSIQLEKQSICTFFEYLDQLLQYPDANIRRWAMKGLWRLMHVVGEMGEEIDSIWPGLENIECGLVTHDFTVSALFDSSDVGNGREKDRKTDERSGIIGKAFAQTLLYRLVLLQQHGRRLGSQNSFALGSTSGSRDGRDSIDEAVCNEVLAEEGPSTQKKKSMRRARTSARCKSIYNSNRASAGLHESVALTRKDSEYPLPGKIPGGDRRTSGLQTNRLTALLTLARRSSLSQVGSVHTFASGDLSFGRGEGSALGLDSTFCLPRLTDIHIPEDTIYTSTQQIWSSKNQPSSVFEASMHSIQSGVAGSNGSKQCGIEYIDCATLLEILLCRVVQPTDFASTQTVNPFNQVVSKGAKDLIPLLFYMLSWMDDNMVRKEFLVSIYTLVFSKEYNAKVFSSTKTWRTNLLRVLQAVPRDKDLRDESTEILVSRIFELVSYSACDNISDLQQLTFETVTLSGWNKQSISLVRAVLGNIYHRYFSSPEVSQTVECTHQFFQFVEMFVLYMPCREDAMLGYDRKNSRLRRTGSSKQHADKSSAVGPDEVVDSGSDSDEDEEWAHRSGGHLQRGSSWMWDPVLKLCSQIQMAENQVDYLEFKECLQRRGVDFGMHLDRANIRFVDESIIRRSIYFCKRSNDVCLNNIARRLELCVEIIQKASDEARVLEESSELGIDENTMRSTLQDLGLELIRKRVALYESLSETERCTCVYCENNAHADRIVLETLEVELDPKTSPKEGASLHDHFSLFSKGKTPCKVTDIEHHRFSPRDGTSWSTTNKISKLCVICKHDAVTKSDLKYRYSMGEDADEQVGGNLSALMKDVTISSDQSNYVKLNESLWHRNHFRCYNCARVLVTGDENDQPVFDKYSAWCFCSECSNVQLSRCLMCMLDCSEGDQVLRLEDHRLIHKTCVLCAVCGSECDEDSTDNILKVPLCNKHKSQERLPQCITCQALITEPEKFSIKLGKEVYIHSKFPCFSCCGCMRPLSKETAFINDVQPLLIFCQSCVETCARPTCAICKTCIKLSSDEYLIVPLKSNRIDAYAFELVDGVITGNDGRLRCHTTCLACTVCGVHVSKKKFKLVPSNDISCFKIYCEEHGKTISSIGESISSEIEETEDPPQTISAGLFLYVDSQGRQAGPVDGQQLCHLAETGAIHASTNVWTPGMSEW
eukprot:CAMPEP_0203759012 /NCGR_PEP_ID=MMETSP0098-20131031/11932_1 /ASSEMBLY_ACC=CAM_ASM_000208 /TAXON_ID=96639 /ORGANISM=" , Strain NY0313808BC1" /LENGTH=1317 /DNA_ID=CAMNT_0050651733 /DNA_START=66 /DNA_END=4016 /DNA_ORIENTATION=+